MVFCHRIIGKNKILIDNWMNRIKRLYIFLYLKKNRYPKNITTLILKLGSLYFK